MLKGKFGWKNHSFLIIVATLAMAVLGLGLHDMGAQVGSTSQITLPNCPEKCGNITIPYPFGIGDKCHYNHPEDGKFYNVSCDSSKVPKYGGLEIDKITVDGEFHVINDISYICYDNNGTKTACSCHRSWIRVTRFAISTTRNVIGAIGCDTYAVFSGTRMSSSSGFVTGCVTGCSNQSDVGTECSGIGCCEVSMPKGVTNISISTRSLNHHRNVQMFNPCSTAFIVAKNHGQSDKLLPYSIKSIITKDVAYFKHQKNLLNPIVYDWTIGRKNCEQAKLDKKHYLCKGNTLCYDLSPHQWGYRCKCKSGFQGNPYLHDCQDIDECAEEKKSGTLCKEPAWCVNTIGSYNCSCPPGYSRGNGTFNDPCIADDKSNDLPIIFKIIGGVGGGAIVCLIIAFYMHWQHGKRELEKLRKSFFHQNGGHILQEKLKGIDVSLGNTVEMFTIEELKKATDSFSQSSIIGKGGFGTVYKGNLTRKAITSPNNQVVAVKKSLKVDKTQVEQFINEIIALSQINNKNVVKMLGCCLENEIPLLVYEFISNGTLHEHLHDESKARFLTWDVRLRIATEVSEVLAYLHTTISIPIIHRDIKSANILLDDNYTAKVADFGTSKLGPINHEHLVTTVQGTWGYLDPEYMQTGELTEKSDVYSFGVVLVELLTRKKALSFHRPEDDINLAIFFLRKLNEGCLFDILDDKLVKGIGDGAKPITEQLEKVSLVAKRCLEVKGEERPTMKQVARDLDDIKTEISSHPWFNNKGSQLQEESENLLGDTKLVNKLDYVDESTNAHSSKHLEVVQLMPNEGR